jgi:hypothetical protein
MVINTGSLQLRERDIDHMSTVEQVWLTPEQARFAYEHDAGGRVRCPVDNVVSLYRVESQRTTRWIVDQHGHILESTEFYKPDFYKP